MRGPRLHAPSTVQHVIARFVGHEPWLNVPGARRAYVSFVRRALAGSDWVALAFALMSTHVHWLFWAGERPSASIMQSAHVAFAKWLNRRLDRIGPVFAERHRSIIVSGDSAAAVVAYVHNNPVHAGVVSCPAQSRWTSHRAFVGLSPAPPWLDVARALSLCGFDDSLAGRTAFDVFTRERVAEPGASSIRPMDDPRALEGHLRARRAAVRAALGAPVEVGTPILSAVGGAADLGLPVVARAPAALRPRWAGDVLVAAEQCGSVCGVSLAELRSRARHRRVAGARRVVLLAWTEQLGRTRREMASALGITESAACRLVQRANTRERAIAARAAARCRDYAMARRAPGSGRIFGGRGRATG